MLCEVWALGSFSDQSHSAGRCPHPWSGFSWETLPGAGVGWAKLQGMMNGLMWVVFIHFWALHSSTEWCCVGNGESDTLLKAFHFHNRILVFTFLRVAGCLQCIGPVLFSCPAFCTLSALSWALSHSSTRISMVPQSGRFLGFFVFFFNISYLISILVNKLFHRSGWSLGSHIVMCSFIYLEFVWFILLHFKTLPGYR